MKQKQESKRDSRRRERREHVARLAKDSVAWGSRKLRMTYSQSWRIEAALQARACQQTGQQSTDQHSSTSL